MFQVSKGQITSYLQQENINFKYYGKEDAFINGFSSFTDYKDYTLTWLKSYDKYIELSKEFAITGCNINGIIIVDYKTQAEISFDNAIICENPKHIFYLLLKKFFSGDVDSKLAGKYTIIDESARIDTGVVIGNGCYIGKNVVIKEGTKIYHNVVINNNVKIGKDCCIKSGTVIGEDGYGYSEADGAFYHVPHFGSVTICDNVEIGANTCIDRGSINDTYIGEGSKIDNLCHIAHNVCIGKNVMIVAGVIIAGSTCIRDNAYIAPGAIIRNQLSVGEKCIIGMGSVITKDAENRMVYTGIPAKAVRKRGKENL